LWSLWPRQDESQLGGQVAERGLDLLLGPGGIPRLQRFEGETGIVVLEEGDVGVALRCLPDDPRSRRTRTVWMPSVVTKRSHKQTSLAS
jgi:hypothetical protein